MARQIWQGACASLALVMFGCGGADSSSFRNDGSGGGGGAGNGGADQAGPTSSSASSSDSGTQTSSDASSVAQSGSGGSSTGGGDGGEGGAGSSSGGGSAQGGAPGTGGGDACGDDDCDGGETCESCPDDCGECAGQCGDDTCDDGETCDSCEEDCGLCEEDCSQHGDCDDDELCDDDGACRSAYGRAYVFTVVSATFPAIDPQAGTTWDPVGLPDPFVELCTENACPAATTTTRDDTASPVWNETFLVPFEADQSTFAWFDMWDEDFDADDFALETPINRSTDWVDVVRNQDGTYEYVASAGLQLRIDIRPQ